MTSGLLLIIGFGTRVAAVALAVTMVGAVVTAGVQDGGFFHLGIAPAMFFAMMILVWTGAGTASFDARLTAKLRG
jgi:putative oxidoreductase